ncbi:zinc finger BED domain-containing protein 1-like [Photinus pyralis]|uniref:zinc finger BED domain-containing protein 1-like n=1 Tax=Photinus pyralis TaxID=7054 RepID=UPI0012676E7D|nr:zinc finger BED domain-containing protein 1-like [Photinus pyralis]
MVVSDNAANIKAAVQTELGWKHFGCFAHSINLVVNDGLKGEDISQIINKVKYIVGHFKRSHSATQKLLTYQQNQGTGVPLKLLQDVATRWNSTFYMLERFIALEDTVKATMALTNMDPTSHLTTDEWVAIKQILQVLKPFEKVTKTVSGEGYLTASLVIPLANGLISVYKGFVDKPVAESEIIRNMLRRINKSLDERFGKLENSNTLSMATFLDPRFKSLAFKDKRYFDITKKNVISLVAEKIAQSKQSVSEDEPMSSACDDPTGSEDEIWADFDKEASECQPIGSAVSKAIIEVQRYLDCDRLDRKQDPLKWWKEHKYMLPHLALVAQERQSAIATSVPCEREFSKAGLILTDRRSRLSSTKTKMLLFLNSNRKVATLL